MYDRQKNHPKTKSPSRGIKGEGEGCTLCTRGCLDLRKGTGDALKEKGG